jgi:ferredoxin
METKRKIYYFSGTGNSLRAATVLAQALGQTEIVSMRCDPAEVSAADAETVGFVFPVYHWTLCDPVREFVSRLEINPRAYVFAVSTPSFINGYAFEVLDGLLRKKGVKLQYSERVFSVANFCIVYPPFPNPKRRVPATERKLAKISARLRERATNVYAKAGWLTRKIYPRMMPKYRAVQAEVDRGFYADETCLSCGVCARVCPKKNIVMENGRPAFIHRCSSCMACVCYCPVYALQYRMPPEQLRQFSTLFTRAMKLPARRLRYHNPYVTAADLMADRKWIE